MKWTIAPKVTRAVVSRLKAENELSAQLLFARGIQTTKDKDAFKSRLGHCYELAGRYVFNHFDEGILLVHGTINGRRWTGLDKDNPHAWVEEEDDVYDLVWDKRFPKQLYYEVMNAKADKKYNFKELCQIVGKKKHWGPWDVK